MKYRIEETATGLSVEVTEAGDAAERVVDAFRACQVGQCGCPSTEYVKVEAMDMERSRERIHVTMKAKPGERIEKDQVERCLEFTLALAAKP